MRPTRFLMAAAATAGVILGGALAASAGEVTGNGELKEVRARSICAYSGQNDGFHIPDLAHDEFDAAQRVQSFGQIVRHVGPIGGIPGLACNPNRGFGE